MKKLLSIISVLLISITVACTASKEQPADRPGVEASNIVKLSAIVEAVDHKARILTLRGEGGQTTTLQVTEEARNLDQVEVGDTVEVEYYESIALFVQDPTGDTGMKGDVSAARTPKGDKPGVAAAETVLITVTVAEINHETRMVTLKGPEGNTFTTRVGEGAKRLDEVKQGDELVVRYTRAFAITVREP
jgi:Cu/Ag efflux protein CusF